MPRVAQRQRAWIRRLRELRQCHGDDGAASKRVRVGASGQQPPVLMGRQEGHRDGGFGGDSAGGILRSGEGEGASGRLVRPVRGSEAPGCRGLPDPLRVELRDGERLCGRPDDLLAVLRRPADELPVRVHGVGHRRGGRRGREEGGHRGDGSRRDGRRGERAGDEGESSALAEGGRDCCFGRRVVADQLRSVLARSCPFRVIGYI